MDQIIDNIRVHLTEMGIQPDLVEPKILMHLHKIEETLSNKFNALEQINEAIIKNRPSINNISSESKVARQTVYNNAILKEYIEYRINQYAIMDPGKRAERLLERIAELEDTVRKMMERDVGLELMRNKISLLEKELQLTKQENHELHNKYNNLKQTKDSKLPTRDSSHILLVKN
ncbi:hypothetical protein COLU111180_20425 [Cohnella lubricantis]|uniref:Uncharacterized protein n=1 Tax=Cohnella lubricantis TaxID=2163172 RepID=A0A841T7Q6_9BACL|nr:hypothetical protein [Cohnella lubricantis]MBB6677354.1 hypothetical protein [Cohnella lubricantis]MBP2120599.1 putative RNase H-like nuclease (RuvC/YqgF family) [Cohnella lubricantis]